MNQPQTPVIATERLSPMSKLITPEWLAQHVLIKPDEYTRTGLISTPDLISPKIPADSTLLVVWLEPDQYNAASGLVAITTSDKPGKVVFGRVELVTALELHISQHRPEWDLVLKVPRSLITSILSIRYIVDAPAL